MLNENVIRPLLIEVRDVLVSKVDIDGYCVAVVVKRPLHRLAEFQIPR